MKQHDISSKTIVRGTILPKKMKALLTSLVLLICIGGKAQTQQIQGRVYDEQNELVPVFDVIVLRSDSSSLVASTFMNGFFNITIPDKTAASRLCIRSMGYGETFIDIPQTNTDHVIDFGEVKLAAATMALAEVVVKGRRPTVRIAGDTYIVDVSKSYLAKAGTFLDVVRRIPGIEVSNKGDIQVMGKPRLQVYLNGRMVRSMSELTALQSHEIRHISIDRNPSTSYASSIDAIVNITTVDAIKDYMQLVVTADASLARRFSHNAGVTLNGKAKNIVYFTDLRFADDALRQYDTEAKQLWTDTQQFETHRSNRLLSDHRTFRYNQVIEYQLRPQTHIGVAYHLSIANQDRRKEQDFTAILQEQRTAIPTFDHRKLRKVGHNPSLYFVSRGKNNHLGLFADYYGATSDDTQQITENNQHKPPYLFSDHYHVAGLKADYSQEFSFLSYSAGGRISYIKDQGRYTSVGHVNEQTSKQASSSYAAYLNLSKQVAPFLFTAGIRFESERVKSVSNHKVALDTTYTHLFPYLLMSYSATSIKASLSYSKRIYRPSYNQLIGKNVYIDPLSYSVGNPLLRSTLVDVVSLSVQKGMFTGMLSYMHHSNKRAQIALLDAQNGVQKIKFTYDNIPHLNMLQLHTTYHYNLGKMKGNTTLMLTAQHMKYGQMSYATFKDIAVYAKTNLETPLWKNASLMMTLRYLNAQYNDFYWMKSSFNSSLFFSQSLFGDQIKLTLAAEDIFKTENANNWTQRLQFAKIGMMTNADTRSLTLSVRYMFGRSKQKSHSKSAIQDDINRL